MMMDGYGHGFGGLIIMLLGTLLVLIPIGRILTRIGFSWAWAILTLIPFVNLVALWIFAFIDWPNRPRRTEGADK